MLLLLRDPRLTHVAGATDHVIESFRNDLFAGYKTGEGMPEDLTVQFAPAEEAITALGMCLWPMVAFEADDALAAGAHRFADQVDNVFLCTPDKDLMQCVGGNVRVWDRRRNILYDEDAVVTKFGVPPRAIADFLALVGDAADGIPGLQGWGKGSASAMLSLFGSIDQFPADVREWPKSLRAKEKLASVFLSERSNLELYRELARLRTDVPFAQSLDDLQYRGVPEGLWRAFCSGYGINEAVLNAGLAQRGR